MSTLTECLRSLPGDLVMRDLSAVRDRDATVAEHIARLGGDEDGYEVRHGPRNFGKGASIAVGVVGGPAILREM
jgi:hypothetical protein